MPLISALHNLSRSLGVALLAASDSSNLVVIFVGGEIGLYLLFKAIRGDFYWFPRTENKSVAIVIGLLDNIIGKIVTDFSGCLHFRHPFELGTFESERLLL